jgi:FkbM family methyltransferase
MINLLRSTFPENMKVKLIQLYHCILLLQYCKDWPIAIADRLHFRNKTGRQLLRLRNGCSVSVELGTFETQIIAEIFGEKTYTPVSLSKYWDMPKLILDIGANKGIFSLFAATLFPDAMILAYEPDPNIFVDLKQNISINGLQNRCVLYNSAVWNCNGSILFATADPKNLGIGRLIDTREDSLRTTKVSTIAFSEILKKHKIVNFVKMDVEGGEYSIILGTPHADLSRVKFMALEYHCIQGHDVRELVEYLNTAGFSTVLHSRGSMLYAWQKGEAT